MKLKLNMMQRLSTDGRLKLVKFIKVIEANEGGCVLLLNTDCIGCIQAGKSGKDTYIRMNYNYVTGEGKSKPEYYFVKETLEQIEGMMK